MFHRKRDREIREMEAKLAALPEPDLTDPDNPEWTEADFARARRPEDVLSPAVLAQFPNTRIGRPRSEAPKQHVSLRLSPDVLAHYRALGKGWQAQIEADLRASISGRSAKR
jgi:uncharacterized protein (DUF4415 family)